MTPLTRATLRRWAERMRPRYEAALQRLVEIPTVSAHPERRPDIHRAAVAAAELVRALGGTATVEKTRGNPVVLGLFDAGAGAPAVTLYNHLDVQPADRAAEGWRTEPFVFTRKGDRYFGRGTTDDKGPALAALFGVAAARQAGVPATARLLWEFEEEIGSPSLEGLVRRQARRLGGHSVLVSDAAWLNRSHPSSLVGLRGFVGFRFLLETAAGEAHSGDVGGAARNPLGELMQLATGLHDARTGRVRVPGFYHGVRRPSAAERRDFRRSGFSLAAYRRDNRLRRLRTTDALEVLERIWARPTFEVHGLVGGYTGPGLKATVAGRGELKASCRLVPGQDPARVGRLVAAYARRLNPDVKVVVAGHSEAYEGEVTGPVADAVRASMRFAFGKEPAFVRDGGTIGAVVMMRKVLGCPVAFLNLSLPEHGYHAPNENFDWPQAEGGIAAFARYLEEVARTAPAPRARRSPGSSAA